MLQGKAYQKEETEGKKSRVKEKEPRRVPKPMADHADWGVQRAQYLLLNPSSIEELTKPDPYVAPKAATPFFDQPTPTEEERVKSELQITAFKRKLKGKDEYYAYLQRLRMDPKRFEECTATMESETRERRGLRISRTSTQVPKEAYPEGDTECPLASSLILADAWNYVDPMQLQVYADMRRYGMNLATNLGPECLPLAGKRTRNMPTAQGKYKILEKLYDKEVKAGKSKGPYTEQEIKSIYPRCFCAPIGLARKDDTKPETDVKSWRSVQSWSSPFQGGPSITERTDTVKTKFINPQDVRDMVVRAHREYKNKKAAKEQPSMLAIDFESAFTQNWVAEDQRIFMVYHIPKKGFYIRKAGDFGMKTCGYRFELLGQIAMSMYRIMEGRLFVNEEGKVWMSQMESPLSHPINQDLGSLERDEGDLLTEVGKQRLERRTQQTAPRGYLPVRLSGFLRWCDDMAKVYPSKQEAIRALAAIAFLHRRYGWKIKVSKVFIAPRLPFTGIILDPTFGTLAIPPDKASKYRKKLKRLTNSRIWYISVDELASMTGMMAWVSIVLPQLSPLTKPFYAHLRHLENAKLEKRVTLKIPNRLRRAANVMSEALKNLPAQLAIVNSTFGQNEADEIIHIDWAGENEAKGRKHRIAVVLVSRGLYTYCDVPEWVIAACGKKPFSPAAGEALGIALSATTFPDILGGKRVTCFTDSSAMAKSAPNLTATDKNALALDLAYELGALAMAKTNTVYNIVDTPRKFILADPLVNANGSNEIFLQKWKSAGLPGKPLHVSPLFPKIPSYWKLP